MASCLEAGRVESGEGTHQAGLDRALARGVREVGQAAAGARLGRAREGCLRGRGRGWGAPAPGNRGSPAAPPWCADVLCRGGCECG